AYELEKIIHGTPSGGDNSASCFGGLVWFQKSNPNIIMPLKNEISYKLENFVLVNSGPPEKNTGELIQHVRDLSERIRNPIIKEIGKMTHEMKEVLKRKDFSRMKEIINKTQKNLSKLGISTKNIDEITSAVRGMGGAAKLCGAGGGGIVLAYHEDKDQLLRTIKDLGYDTIETELGAEGVRVEIFYD
ncbi:MAG: hypothetical protein QMD85_04400, partial [Candidatus Aenigmarchaeota archaeon]|nr:hypothetical protein [Candidatus Aenigmarchaeota archaeon]MDI6722815.1 hypothetical protein [Candidatus Aenigmarchaeota archaeon]